MAFKTANSYIDFDVSLYGRDTYDTTTTPSNEVKIKASEGNSNDYFASSVAVGCGRIVVGAFNDTPLGIGIDSGSAYIFNLNGTQLAKIVPSDPGSGDGFGRTVAIGCNRIVIGSASDDISTNANRGSAYIFDLNGTQIAKITASDGVTNDYFGTSVGIGCGRIVVSAYLDDDKGTDSGSAYIFDLNGTQIAKITASEGAAFDAFGYSVFSVGVGCGRIVIGSPNDADNGSLSGSAYIFDLNGNQLAKIKPSDGVASDRFGTSVGIGSGRIVVSSPYDDSSTGAAYIFDLNGTQIAKIKPSDAVAGDFFGDAIAVGSGRIVGGAYNDADAGFNTGAAYVFDLNGTQIAKIRPSDSRSAHYFGTSIAAGSGRIVVGTYRDNDLGFAAGAAYIYTTPNQPHILDILDDK